jgi:anaerobic selenocysteine-containing dehydrogenase
MLAELADVLTADFRAERSDSTFPFRLVPRRHNNFMNSSGTSLGALNRGKPYNPTYMHPDAIAALGLKSGDLVTCHCDCSPMESMIAAAASRRGEESRIHRARETGSAGIAQPDQADHHERRGTGRRGDQRGFRRARPDRDQ